LKSLPRALLAETSPTVSKIGRRIAAVKRREPASSIGPLTDLELSQNAQFSDRPGGCKLLAMARGIRRSGCGAASGHGLPRQLIRRGVPRGPVEPLQACYISRLPLGYQTVARMIDTVTKPRTKAKPKTERPKLHKVILVNDDFTPREFVVTVLKAEFRMTEDQAHKVMITAHRLGVCVVAVFTKDVAETKATRATDAGRAKGYPLLFTTEPEE
jgi:ATP-dependent Clp protease adaptor protein ClpS